jgi:hypothetical protein
LSKGLSNSQLWSWESVKEILCLLGYVSFAQARKSSYSSEHGQLKEEALATLVEIRRLRRELLTSGYSLIIYL